MAADPEALAALGYSTAERSEAMHAAARALVAANPAPGRPDVEVALFARFVLEASERLTALDRWGAGVGAAIAQAGGASAPSCPLTAAPLATAGPGRFASGATDVSRAGGGPAWAPPPRPVTAGPDRSTPSNALPVGVAVVFGDPTTAEHIAVVVPEVGTDTVRADAQRLYAAAEALDPGAVAVLAWTGHERPGFLDSLAPAAAGSGSQELASFVTAMDHRPDATTTVVGHGHGSVTAAQALGNGMAVDDVVVLGSPGLGVGSIDDLPLHGAELYAARAPLDAVALSETFGRDPTDPRFGATRLSTGDAGDAVGHGSYLDAGSVALANVAAVVVGQDNRLQTRVPSAAERAAGAVDDLWRRSVGSAVDGRQAAVSRAARVARDFVERLPGPLAPALGLAVGAGTTALDGANRVIDTVQRVASPDFVTDLAGDVIALLPR
ncbi:MAG: alpha/beta hydrolase [Acidimicrobiia bacterium]